MPKKKAPRPQDYLVQKAGDALIRKHWEYIDIQSGKGVEPNNFFFFHDLQADGKIVGTMMAMSLFTDLPSDVIRDKLVPAILDTIRKERDILNMK